MNRDSLKNLTLTGKTRESSKKLDKFEKIDRGTGSTKTKSVGNKTQEAMESHNYSGPEESRWREKKKHFFINCLSINQDRLFAEGDMNNH